MKNSPLISVLMPVYNGEKYLKEAIDSILNQTYTNFEFLIINDGSSDGSEKIILSYTDKRIKYIKNSQNLGLSETLNKGLKIAKGKYIGRMDCDDLSQKSRFEKQVEFLESNSEYGVVGCFFALLNQNRVFSEVGGVKLTDDEDLRLSLVLGNIFCHGETMIRKSLIDKNNIYYQKKYNPCEDYYFWTQVSKNAKMATLPEVLYFYMINPEGMSLKGERAMKSQIKNISGLYKDTVILPKVGISDLDMKIKKGRMLKDKWISVNKTRIFLYGQLSYQVFLFRLGKVYLRSKRIDGFLFFLASFMVNPANWFGHMFRLRGAINNEIK